MMLRRVALERMDPDGAKPLQRSHVMELAVPIGSFRSERIVLLQSWTFNSPYRERLGASKQGVFIETCPS